MAIAMLLAFIRALGLGLPLSIVAGWSAAEAALFILVADIPISWIAVRSGTRAAILAAIVAAFASMLGTAAILMWAGHDHAAAASVMLALPGVDAALIAEAADSYGHGPYAVLVGAFSGIPFKLFTLEAARNGGLSLLLMAPLLRLPRFLLVALFSGWVSRLLERWMTRRQRLFLLAGVWVAFYAAYFSVMPG